MEGTCTPVAADFMLPFLGRAAAGGKEVRGSRHASEDGPLRDGVRKKDKRFSPSFIKLLLRQKICLGEGGKIKLDEEYQQSASRFCHSFY